MDIIDSLLKTGNKTANINVSNYSSGDVFVSNIIMFLINVKNCCLYTLLTETDLKPQKS